MTRDSKYGPVAKTWDRVLSRHGYHRAYEDFLDRHIKVSGAVLDVGTGTGAFARAWLRAGGSNNLTLMDASKAMLGEAGHWFETAGLTVRLIHSRLEDCRLEQTFQTILASHVIEHCDDPGDALARLAGHLAPDGRLILSVSKPHWCNWLIWLRFRHKWFRPDTIRDLASNAGLTRIAVHHFSSGPPSRTSLGYVFRKA